MQSLQQEKARFLSRAKGPDKKHRSRVGERLIIKLLQFSVLISILTTVGIVVSLLTETVAFFREVSIVEFLTSAQWTPLFKPQHFGILPLFSATMLISLGAGLLALPIGLASAVYLSEYAPDRVRRIVKPMLEILAGVPSVVYGYFALTFVTPALRRFIPDMDFFNALSASIVLGVMLIPMISSLSEDAMMAVPRSLREAAYALGATRFEVASKVVVPAAFSGIIASAILAFSRAVGETMIVTIAAGAQPALTFNFLEGMQTMTAFIVQISLGDTPHGTIEYKTLFAVGFALFLITLAMNVLGQMIIKRFREVYQ